jgi:hypothetical protein
MENDTNMFGENDYCLVANVSYPSKDLVISALSLADIPFGWSCSRAVGFVVRSQDVERARKVLRADALVHDYHITFANVVKTAIISIVGVESARIAIEAAGIIFNTNGGEENFGVWVEPDEVTTARAILASDAQIHGYEVRYVDSDE